MATAGEAFDGIADRLATNDGVQRAKMFGMPGLKLGTTAFAGLFGDDMVFKLGAGTKEHADAMKLDGAKTWDPSGQGRPFKDWVQVPSTSLGRWSALADQAFERVLAAT
jgi:hypothetical protein